MSKIPVVKIDTVSLKENCYENYNRRWSVIKLIKHSEKYPVFDMPLAGIDLTRKAWNIDDLDDFIHHANRCNKANLDYPIILDENGCVADGVHRIAKAIMEGRETIKAIRLESMPDADCILESKE